MVRYDKALVRRNVGAWMRRSNSVMVRLQLGDGAIAMTRCSIVSLLFLYCAIIITSLHHHATAIRASTRTDYIEFRSKSRSFEN